jgi:hypothetical protein
MLNLTRLHLGIAHESQFQGRGINVIILALLLSTAAFAQQYPGRQSAYYFAASGNDSNPCTQAQPCQTLNKAGTIAYSPGNTINFNGGDNFTGCWSLTPTNVPSRGDKNSPIVVQSYGTGRATLMSNCTGNNVPLFDIGVLVASYLKFVAGHPSGTQRGIMIEGPGDTIIIKNNEVTGFQINSVGAEILVVGFGTYTQSGCNPLNNVQILNNDLHGATATSTDDNGIYGFGCKNISGAHYAGNHVWNLGGGSSANPAFSPNGIAADGTNNAIIEHNLIHDIGANQTTCGGPTGIIVVSGSATVQFNEVYQVAPVVDQGGCDWAGLR